MFNMPFFGFPYYRNYYARPYFPKPNMNYNNVTNNSNDSLNNNAKKQQNNSTTNNNFSSTINDNSRSSTCKKENEPFINIFGIDLYSDDILILCILLSLYLEGVKDEMLFISLILLLLS
ncbi:MAG: hypothetical protein IKF38_03285 [Clostridia bacterium]|nr:hypothetical protein [Clostridia bacterium]